MNLRDSIALQIYVKRLPPESLIDGTASYFKSKTGEAYKLADLFLAERISQEPEPTTIAEVLANLPPEETK